MTTAVHPLPQRFGRARVVVPPGDASGALSPAQHARRAQGLGASDVAAVLGLSKYKSPFDVYLEKRGLLPARADVILSCWVARPRLEVFRMCQRGIMR